MASAPLPQGQSSISHTSAYEADTRAVARDPALMRTFRVHDTLARIFDIVGDAEAHTMVVLGAFAAIAEMDPAFLVHNAEAMRNDRIGSPVLVEAVSGIAISACSARYLKYACDIQALHGDIRGWSVAEIGGAYGGLFRLMNALNGGALDWYDFDLPPVLELAQSYLGHFEPGGFHPCLLEQAPDREYDLLISTHALSEIRRDIQRLYLERVVRRARHGYILYNYFHDGSAGELPIMSPEEICAAIPGARQITDFPFLMPLDRNGGHSLILW